MGDLIQTYKIINKIEEVDIDMGTGHNFMVGVETQLGDTGTL